MSNLARIVVPALALVVGLAAGVVVGVSVAGDGGYPDDDDADTVETARTTGRDTARRGDDATEAGERGTRRRGVSTDDVAVENAMRGTDAVAVGDGAVTGMIRDALGNAMAGVEIESMPEFTPDEEDDDEPDSLEKRLRQVVRSWRFQEGARRTTTTGPDGTYRIERLVDGEYSVTPRLDGFTFRTADYTAWSVYTGNSLDFVAIPVVRVTAAVRLPDGTPPAHAVIEWRMMPSGESDSISWSPDNPHLDLGPGRYEMSATGGEHDAFRATAVPLEVVADQPTTVDIPLVERSGVAGKISFPGPELPSTVGVMAISVADGGEADIARLYGSPHQAWIGEPFEYALLDMSPGPYLVGVLLRNGKLLDQRIVEVGSGLARHDVAVTDADVRDYVRVRVHAPDGSVPDDVSVQTAYAGDGGESWGESVSERDEGGAYRAPHMFPGSAGAGFGWGGPAASSDPSDVVHFVAVTSAEYGMKRIAFDPQRDYELDVTFDQPAFLVASVENASSTGMSSRLSVALATGGGSGGGMSAGPFAGEFVEMGSFAISMAEVTASVDLDGLARVGPVAPGSYQVKLYAHSDEAGTRQVATRQITLAPGETSLSLTVPELHFLRIRVEGRDLDLDLHPVAGPGEGTTFLDEGVREGGGVTRFSLIPPGRYRVRSYGDGSIGEMIVTVPANGTLTFDPTPYDCVRVEGGHPQWRGLLEYGDLIVAVGGEEMPNDHRIMAALAMARSEERVTLTVMRGGRTFDVDVPTEPFDAVSLVRMSR